jgi:hypothetical protein
MNNGVIQRVSRQRIGKHVPAATNTNTTIELLLETVFSTRSVQSGYEEDNWGDAVSCQLLVESWVLHGGGGGGVKIGAERGKLKNLNC